ncbi:MAG: hypothetical protein ISR83_01395 [Candidatus Marinimicrobia bacterium]|nr:hypothetical protein [Candidatus Neomarinimicrobiota bacterium]
MILKKTVVVIFSILFIFSCQSYDSDGDSSLYYNGIKVSQENPSFISHNKNMSARGVTPNGEIESSPPYGTVYGHENDPNHIYLSQGGELLSSGSWAAQIFSDIYQISLYPNTKASWDQFTVVTFQNAIGCFYLDYNGTWQSVAGNGTIEAWSIKTGSQGTVDLFSDEEIELEIVEN